jgi:hypothetical protein
VFLDDPFAHIEPKAKPSLLEQLVAASRNQQVIYLTEDADVVEWARVESMTGDVAIIEPGVGAPADATGESAHVVA